MSDWKPIETCPVNKYVWLANDDPKERENYAGEFSGVSVYPYLGKKVLSPDYPPRFHLTDNDGLAIPDPTLWMAIKPPPAPWVWQHASPGYFPLYDESPGPREKPGGELHWNQLSTCPVDEEVWLIDNDDKGPYVGKILKPSAHRASFTNVPLFCALEDRDDHPNPVMWAKKNKDSNEPPAEPIEDRKEAQRVFNSYWMGRETRKPERTTRDYQSNLHAIHERLNTMNDVIRKRFCDIDTQLEKICEWLDLSHDARRVVDSYTREALELLNRKPPSGSDAVTEKGPVSETS